MLGASAPSLGRHIWPSTGHWEDLHPLPKSTAGKVSVWAAGGSRAPEATDLTGGKGTHASRRPGSCSFFRRGQFSPLGVSIGQETQEGPGVLTCHRVAQDPEESDPREPLCHHIITKYRHQAKCFPLIISLKSSERPYRVYVVLSI